ncbi:MAG TPA: hypothetical protein VM450_07740 [Thermomicrobiales bacterium]|nr:hypothetical protein [Thermomicrobiales bacterium]
MSGAMIEHQQMRRRTQEHRSQLATELLILVYAVLATIVLIRTVLVLLDITERIWIGSFIFGLTAPVTDVLMNVPGLGREIVGPLTMTDIFLLALVVLFPLGMVATSGRDR